MIIALWKGVVDYFKIEITHFMIDSFRKFAVSNTDIKTQEAAIFVTECTTSEQQYVVVYIFPMSPKYFKFAVQISSKYSQLYDSNFANA